MLAKEETQGKAYEAALGRLGFVVLDSKDFPPGKIADFRSSGNFVRNVALLRNGLRSTCPR